VRGDPGVASGRLSATKGGDMASDPKVRSAIPQQARPGEIVVLAGSGLERGDRVELWGEAGDAPEKVVAKRATKWLSPERAQIVLPQSGLSGGLKRVAIERGGRSYPTDGRLTVLPEVSALYVVEGTELSIRGAGFSPDAHVRLGDVEVVPTRATASRLDITLPQDVPLADALSPSITAPSARPLLGLDVMGQISSSFRVRQDGFSFGNDPADHMAGWGAFVETFGEEHVRTAQRWPTFLFLWAYYALYTSFFEGVGPFKASGLCSGLAALCLERFCAGAQPSSFVLPLDRETRKALTVRMGRILGREILVAAYDQCKRGPANTATTLSAVQAALRDGIRADTAQLLWFLPGGGITERKFMEQLAVAHSVVPYEVAFDQDGDTARWTIAIYDVNMPGREDARVEIRQKGNEWSWSHNRDSRFSSAKGLTLAAIPLRLFQEPAEFPFSGRFGLTGFLFDMLT